MLDCIKANPEKIGAGEAELKTHRICFRFKTDCWPPIARRLEVSEQSKTLPKAWRSNSDEWRNANDSWKVVLGQMNRIFASREVQEAETRLQERATKVRWCFNFTAGVLVSALILTCCLLSDLPLDLRTQVYSGVFFIFTGVVILLMAVAQLNSYWMHSLEVQLREACLQGLRGMLPDLQEMFPEMDFAVQHGLIVTFKQL